MMYGVLVAATFLAVSLAIVCAYDFRWFIIPDWVNAAILAGGLAWQFDSGWVAVGEALFAALLVATCMWALRHMHLRLRGVVGLGLGDVKLAAASSVWFPLSLFPVYLFTASGLGLIYYFCSRIDDDKRHGRRIAFGPFLAASLFLTWMIELNRSKLAGLITWL